jgi:ankyrin repeat protein
LHHAARDNRALGIVATLLAHKANPNIRLHQQRPTAAASGVGLEGATPIALAAEINNLEAIKALVEGGADPLVGTLQNTTPLILAAGGGTDLARPRSADERATAVETVKFLVAHGADVNAAGQFGWTALHAAAYQGLDDLQLHREITSLYRPPPDPQLTAPAPGKAKVRWVARMASGVMNL